MADTKSYLSAIAGISKWEARYVVATQTCLFLARSAWVSLYTDFRLTHAQYYVIRNGTSLIAFAIGSGYSVGNGAAIVAGHIDALTAKVKPVPKLRNKAGYVQLGVAPYAGALSDTWWDRDLGIGGRVLVKENGKIITKLVKLDYPIARIPTLAPHFGAAANGPFNKETQMVPIIGLDNSDLGGASTENDQGWASSVLGGEGTFAATQPEKLVKAISGELGITDCTLISCKHPRDLMSANKP